MVKTDNNLGKQLVLLNQLGPTLIGAIRHDKDFNEEIKRHVLSALKYMVDTLTSYAIDKYNLQPLARYNGDIIIFGLDNVYLTINEKELQDNIPQIKTMTENEYFVMRDTLNDYNKYFPKDYQSLMDINENTHYTIFTNAITSILQDIDIDVLRNLLSEFDSNADEDMNDLIYIVNYCVDKVIEDCTS